MTEITEIKRKVYDYPKNNNFFKNNNFANACYKITCVFEKLNIELLHPRNIFFSDIGIMQDKYRGGYREVLKESYLFCSHNTDFSKDMSSDDIKIGCDEICRAIMFNQIRNMFEQCDLHRYTSSVNGGTVTFIPQEIKRDFNAEVYARYIGGGKIDVETKALQSEDAYNLQRYLVDPELFKKWDSDKQEPKTKSIFKEIAYLAYQKLSADAEEDKNYDFGIFTADEFKHCYAILVALGIMNFNYHYISSVAIRFFEADRNTPIIFKKKDEMILFIKEYTKISQEKICSIIDLLTYDPEFHKDKVTIYQPLFQVGYYIFYSPMMVYFSLAQDKLFYIMKENKSYQTIISEIAKDRETIMTNQILHFIDSSQLLYNANYKVAENGKIKAEFDLPVYDEEDNKLLLVELKWFFKGDGEFDHQKIDQKLKKAILSRKEKQEFVEKNIKRLLLDMFNVEMVEKPEIMSCIVSKNYSGSSFIEDGLPIFDQFLFCETMKQCSFKLSKVFDLIKKGDYVPDMRSYGVEFQTQEINYAGYTFNCPTICIKN